MEVMNRHYTTSHQSMMKRLHDDDSFSEELRVRNVVEKESVAEKKSKMAVQIEIFFKKTCMV
jgi:hypothetical protein